MIQVNDLEKICWYTSLILLEQNKRDSVSFDTSGLGSTYGECCSAELKSKEVLFWDI